MATISPTTLITTKILINNSVRRFKIQIKDLGSTTLPGKLKELLVIPANQEVIFERYSDSAGAYIVLDSNKPAVYKQLYRAAKAKLKLRIKVTFPEEASAAQSSNLLISTEPTLPAYASQVTLPVYPGALEPVIAPPAPQPAVMSEPVVPLEVVTNAVAAYLDGEEGRTKLRVTIGEEVEKKMADQKKVEVPAAPLAIAPIAIASVTPVGQAYAVYCNSCQNNVEDLHYHCGVCDLGDFDLCQNCFADGKHCKSESHWMIKRKIVNGEIISSTTESIRVQKKKLNEPEPAQEAENERYCNACCNSFSESEFVQCTTCADYDLCIACHTLNTHGHHPAHTFKPALAGTVLNAQAEALLSAGRNFRHFAVCDGCEQQIYGVRHKCLKCPDWDYCSSCMSQADSAHPGHRFAPIYEALKLEAAPAVRHYGIYCDGPLCEARRCIVGDRYKCAICPDFDLCAACEASPTNNHNATHPFIKFRTAVRHVTVQAFDDAATDRVLGDELPTPSVRTASPTSNAATQVQTVADIEPLVETVPAPDIYDDNLIASIEKPKEEELQATFIQDTIHDGTVFAPGEAFTQCWTVYNKGEAAWPAGVTVKFTGGDSLFEQDQQEAATVTDKEIPVGGHAEFAVKLVAPATSRQQISYWRLVAPDGRRFGPNLWCDIRVSEPPKAPSPEPVLVQTETDTEEKATQDDLLVDSHTSQMIFPTLDKESPVPSITQSTATLAEDKPAEEATVPAQIPSSPSTISGGEFDDVTSETLSYVDEELEDNFISDDEDYEVLMASEDDEDYKSL